SENKAHMGKSEESISCGHSFPASWNCAQLENYQECILNGNAFRDSVNNTDLGN
ncbi:hypothetical protein P7K49_039684, partial [Saguinus oedipus]